MARKSSKRDLKKKYLKEFKFSMWVSFFLFLYVGLLLGACYNSLLTAEFTISDMHNKPTMIDLFANIVPYIIEDPVNLVRLWPTHWLYVAVAMCGWLMYGLFEHDVLRRKYNVMFNDAHGSGGFNDDLEGFYREYVMDPKIVGGKTEKNHEGKDVTTKKIPIGGKKFWLARNVISKKAYDECLLQSQMYSSEVYLSMNAKWTRRNLNAFYLGASGTGKSRFAVKPNILQANSSIVVTDPSGEILKDCGGFLREKGYEIRVLNLKDLSKSNRYNPMAYIDKVSDIPVLINCMLANLEEKKNQGGDSFWTDSTKALLTACTAYQFEVFTEDNEFLEDGKTLNPYYKGKRNFINVMRMLRMAEIHEDEGGTISDLDRLFAELAETNHNSYAVKMYQTFKMAPDKTALNIMISTAVKLGTHFDNDEIANLTYKDEMDIREIGHRYTAVFLITPEGDKTYNFLASMFYNQAFSILYAEGEKKDAEGGDPELDVPVRFLMDEMANIGQIPDFNEKLATMRKYRISCVPIFQSLAQLKKAYKDDWEVVIGNCDTLVFLGGAEPSECKFLSERLGKMTVKTYSYGKSYGGKGGSSDNQQQIGRNVMDVNEIEQMGNNEQLVFIRGVRPFCTEKYAYEKHPNYKYTSGSKDKKYSRRCSLKEWDITLCEEIETDIEDRYIYCYGEDRHVSPKTVKKFDGKALTADNFSKKLDGRTQQLSGGKVKSWKDTVQKQEKKEEEKKAPFVVPSEEDVEKFSPLNDADKANVERKLEEITGKKYTNISEAQFKQLANLSPTATPEQVMEWCSEHLQISGGFSPDYEFSEEEDFLIGEDFIRSENKEPAVEEVPEDASCENADAGVSDEEEYTYSDAEIFGNSSENSDESSYSWDDVMGEGSTESTDTDFSDNSWEEEMDGMLSDLEE